MYTLMYSMTSAWFSFEKETKVAYSQTNLSTCSSYSFCRIIITYRKRSYKTNLYNWKCLLLYWSKKFGIWPVRECFLICLKKIHIGRRYSAFSRYLLLLVKDFWYLVGEGMFPDTKLPRTDQVITTRPLAESLQSIHFCLGILHLLLEKSQKDF